MMAWLLDTLIAVSLLFLAVLLVRRPVAKLFGAGWAYALWLLPVLRAVLPPLPAFDSPFSSALSPPVLIPPAGEVSALQAAAAGSGQWLGLIIGVWALGACMFLAWQLLSYRNLVGRLKDSRVGVISLFDNLVVVESDAVQGPLAMGLFDRRILVPLDFSARYSPVEQRLALEHEATHHRRGDIWWNVAALVVLAMNWFNPLAYLAFKAFRADQELSCDAAVTSRASSSERHDYALALVKSASRPGLIAACPLNHAGQLKRRLKMMKQHRVSRGRTVGGLSAVALTLLSGLFLSAPTAAQEKAQSKTRIFINRVDGSRSGVPVNFEELRAKCGVDAAQLQKQAEENKKGERKIRVVVCGKDGVVQDPEMSAALAEALGNAHGSEAVTTVPSERGEEVLEIIKRVVRERRQKQ